MDKCIIIGGGTFNKVACHLSLATPAFGTTAKKLKLLMDAYANGSVENILTLTKMADSSSSLVTNEDVDTYVTSLLGDETVKAIIMNVALCDFGMENPTNESRLSSSENYSVELKGIRSKIISKIREVRPDIITVGFKTTCNDTNLQQCAKGFNLLDSSNLSYVLANDVGSYNNILITRDMKIYQGSRDNLLNTLACSISQDIKEIQWCRYV